MLRHEYLAEACPCRFIIARWSRARERMVTDMSAWAQDLWLIVTGPPIRLAEPPGTVPCVEPSSIVVSRSEDPRPPQVPSALPIVAVVVVTVGALFGLGRVGEPPATGDETTDSAVTELGSIASTAATTLGTTTTTTEPVLEFPRSAESIESALAAEPLWAFDQELAVPDAMPVVSHVVADDVHLFLAGPTSGPGEFSSGLQVVAWDGIVFRDLVQVAPPDEAVMDVVGGPLGLIATTGRTSLAPEWFGPSSMEPVRIRTSPDGFEWEEVSLAAAGEYIFVRGMAVGASEAWVFGAPRADVFDEIVQALPAGYAELVEAGLLVPVTDGTSGISLYVGGGFTRVASFRLEELGFDPPFNLTFAADVAFRSEDLADWQPAGVPLGIRSLSTDSQGVVYADTTTGVWRSAGDGSWELVALADDLGGGALDATVHDGSVYGWYPGRAGVEVVRLEPEVSVRRYDLSSSGLVAAAPVSGDLAVMFPFSTFPEPPGEVAFAPGSDGTQVIADFGLGQYRVLDDDGTILLAAEIFDDQGDGIGFDPDERTMTLLSEDGEVVASVPLEDARQAFLTAFSTLDNVQSTLYVTDGDTWTATDRLGNGAAIGPIADATSLYLGFVVVEGPFRGHFPTERKSRVFLGLRTTGG